MSGRCLQVLALSAHGNLAFILRAPWCLSVTCSVPTSPEEYRKFADFWEMASMETCLCVSLLRWRIFTCFYVNGTWDPEVDPGLFLRNAWHDTGHVFCVRYWCFRMKEYLVPEVNSRPALLQLFGEVCTVDSSGCPSLLHLNTGHYIRELTSASPSVSGSSSFTVRCCLKSCFRRSVRRGCLFWGPVHRHRVMGSCPQGHGPHDSLHPCAGMDTQSRETQGLNHNHHNNNSPSVPTLVFASPFTMDLGWQPVTGAAQRRRQRRLRSWWRHEQQVDRCGPGHVATPLSPSGKDRAGGWESELLYTAEVRKTPPPQPELFQFLSKSPTAPGHPRLLCLGESWGEGPAAHRGAARRRRAHGGDSGHPWAAGGRPAGGGVPGTLICRFPCKYRGAQDLIFIPTFSQAKGFPQHADDGTVEVPEFVSFAFLFQQQIVDAPGRPQGLLHLDRIIRWCGSRS